MLIIPKGREKEFDLQKGSFAIKPIKVEEGFALPVKLLTNHDYKFCHDLLKKLPVKNVTLIIEDDFITNK